jgi:dTMP kinase
MNEGKFITFEGPEGAGKSTVIRKLANDIKNRGYEIYLTREPGGTPTGEKIRGLLQHDQSGESLDPRTELLLFESSRAQLVSKIIIPQIKRGVWVLCDRFGDSTTAYQGYGRGFDIAEVERLNNFAIGGCVPDLTVLIDVPIEEGFRRLALRKGENGQIGAKDRIESEAREFHERVRNGYWDIAARYPARFAIIEGKQEPDKVYSDTLRVVSERLGL